MTKRQKGLRDPSLKKTEKQWRNERDRLHNRVRDLKRENEQLTNTLHEIL